MKLSKFKYTAKLKGSGTCDFHISKLQSNNNYICYKSGSSKLAAYEIIGPIKTDRELSLCDYKYNIENRARELKINDLESIERTSRQLFDAQEAERYALSQKMTVSVLQPHDDCLMSVTFTADASNKPEIDTCIEQYSQLRIITLAGAMEMTVDDYIQKKVFY